MSPSTLRAVLAALLFSSLGCAALRGGGAERPMPESRAPASAPTILTLMPSSPTARETYAGMLEELGEDFAFTYRFVDDATSAGDVRAWMRETRPRGVVLMNNPSVRVYRRHLASAPRSAREIPVVGVLTSFLRESARGLPNAAGVIYEVPLLTSVVNLRDLLRQPIRRVGVLHRPIFDRFLDEQASLAASEGVELVRVELSNPEAEAVVRGLERLDEEDDVDAIWVLNDNRLLTPDLVRRAWLPALEAGETPVIVNVRSLVSSQVDFGTFAVLPDHFALGVQAGQVLAGIADRGWSVPRSGAFEYPVSVRKVLQLGFARDHLALEESKLSTVDELVD